MKGARDEFMPMRWEQVPAEDHEQLNALIAEMLTVGFPSVQWGNKGVVFGPSGSYRTAFFEAFGEKDGFLRGEGSTVLEAAQRTLVKMIKQRGCAHPQDAWQYTHRNGYKTCGQCGYFTPCSVDEALAHYDHGEVKVPEKATYLLFDFRRPLCPACEGHILAHDYAFDVHRCACGQRLETVTNDDGCPVYDENHNRVLRPVAMDPHVAGFWHCEQRLWQGEFGHITTYRVSQIGLWSNVIDDELRNPNLEFRLVNADLTPGEAVPFSFDREADAKELIAGLEAWLTQLKEPNG